MLLSSSGYEYLVDGRLSKANMPTGKSVVYKYDGLDRLSTSSIDGILNTSYAYESAGEEKTTPLVSSVTTNGKKTEYTYDAYGNILTITEDGVLKHSYTYDVRNQLVKDVSGEDTYVYNYDAGGNLLSVQLNGEIVKTYAYGDESWKDLLTSFNGQAITYDEIGNPLTYRGMNMEWKGGRRLASITKDGFSASYEYNTDGIRTQKTVNDVTTKYYLNGSSVLRQVTGDDVLEFFYDANGVVGFYYNNTPYYYLKNIQGDVIGILDADGTQVVSYTYDAWGNPLSTTGSLADTIGQLNPFRYRSYYYDTETGLYYLNSRYYDAEIGRFINIDNAISATGDSVKGYNLFSYCFNNPVNFDDADGNWPKWLEKTAKVVAYAAVAVTAVAVAAVAIAGTGGLALTVATVAFGAACGGLVGGIANEKKNGSFINGWVGGAVNGGIQSIAGKAFGPAGTIVGGGFGSGVGTFITEAMNNSQKAEEKRAKTIEIAKQATKSAVIGMVMSITTAIIGEGVAPRNKSMSYNMWASSIHSENILAPITPGFGKFLEGFLGTVDDAMAYILCE